jgi:hypothetical protein
VQKHQRPIPEPQEPLAVTPPWSSLILYVPSFLALLVDAGLVLVLLLFMLIAHRDLRDRLFRISIVFWAWLWGPVSLLLATPLTVCLGVLGKYVSYLTFLDVLLSDEPVTDLNRYYQRLVARDQDGAAEIVEELLETRTWLDVYEAVVTPALYYTKQDQRRDNLTADEAHAIYRATHELIDNLTAQDTASSEAVVSPPAPVSPAAHPIPSVA